MINPYGGSFNQFAGMRIYEDSNALEKTDVPMKIHKERIGQKLSYHLRVQKKWIKRFGYVYQPAIFQTATGFICHPIMAAKVRAHIMRAS